MPFIMTSSGNALITGAARRIGHAIALALARDGWNIAVHCHRSRLEADATARELSGLGVTAAVVEGDLSQVDTAAALMAESTRRLGPIRCLVNNASEFAFDDLASLDVDQWDRQMAVNLRAPVWLAREFARRLPQDASGCVINLLDQKVFNLNPDFLSYTLAKVALQGATQTLAMALAPRIRVCAVAPGITLLSGEQSEENFRRAHAEAPLGKSSSEEDVAEAVRFLVRSSSITGETLLVDGGQHLWSRRRDVQFNPS
jgi:NAD(P)-dependent dehydrogenase (short-subunit alcohol dehydrogenase family)